MATATYTNRRTISTDAPAAAGHGRLSRRRQVHAGRAAAVRHELGADRHPRPRRAGEQAQGLDRTDLALLTDGLRAEREQGITIDVAYRYFATPARSSSWPTARDTCSTPATR